MPTKYLARLYFLQEFKTVRKKLIYYSEQTFYDYILCILRNSRLKAQSSCEHKASVKANNCSSHFSYQSWLNRFYSNLIIKIKLRAKFFHHFYESFGLEIQLHIFVGNFRSQIWNCSFFGNLFRNRKKNMLNIWLKRFCDGWSIFDSIASLKSFESNVHFLHFEIHWSRNTSTKCVKSNLFLLW